MNVLEDYLDADVSYLLGLLVARGTIVNNQGIRQLSIEFPFSSLKATGINVTFDQEQSIRLGLIDIQERLTELLETDIRQVKKDNSVDLVIRFMRNNLIWRDLLLILEDQLSFPYFKVPSIFFSEDCPQDWKREFIKGYADVAGNIRPSNNYMGLYHRVRLDILNYPSNWKLGIQICHLLQEQLNIPVQNITWGHPNLGRKWKEHQLNIFADAFLKIGFTFSHKQKILEELAEYNTRQSKYSEPKFCLGKSRRINPKESWPEDESNEEKLDPNLVGNHYDTYWQICQALGCERYKMINSDQLELSFDNLNDEDS
jgi:hypothetical protein